MVQTITCDTCHEIVYITENQMISPEYIDEYGSSRWPARFFHINIKNLNKDASARNCLAYLESYNVIYKKTLEQVKPEVILQPVELKWKGMRTQSVLITPKMNRKFDAIYIYEYDTFFSFLR